LIRRELKKNQTFRAARATGSDCGPWGGGWGFWKLADDTLELHTNYLLLNWTHGTLDPDSFGQWLTDLPEATDIEVQEADYRVLRFRIDGDVVTIDSLTWEPPK
jgi:hypothetical protein